MSGKQTVDSPKNKTPLDDRQWQSKFFGALIRPGANQNVRLSPVNNRHLVRLINFRTAGKKVCAVTVFLAGCLGLWFLPKAKTVGEADESECKCENELQTVNFGFPALADEYKPPAWWEERHQRHSKKFPVFKLSQDFPVEIPEQSCVEDVHAWKNFDFKTQSKAYMTEALKYAFEGNLEIDWRVEENAVRKWIHAPWMHTGKYGREFIHGLTKERKTCREELLGRREECPPDAPRYESWAIAFYNPHGAHHFGRVWNEMLKEKPDPKNFPAAGMPNGSVSLKLIFTQADASVAPYLENSVEWLADTRRATENEFTVDDCVKDSEINERCFDTLRLLQIDLAVRDDRSPTGWVFGTFTYNRNAEPIFDYQFPSNMSQAEKSNLQKWLKLEFVGLMFGNDEGVRLGGELRESVINADNSIKAHLGCGGRLNGVIDAPSSSCFSCHSLAETPANLKVGQMPYKEMECREDSLNKWFKTINPRAAFADRRTFTLSETGKEMISLDYSLQLREGILRYCQENPQKCEQ